MIEIDNSERAERLRDWFELQLLFVNSLVVNSNLTFETAITHYTNLHRRFGFGRPNFKKSNSNWCNFVKELAMLSNHQERLECTIDFARKNLITDSPNNGREFGCFNYDPPSDQCVIRIHFSVSDSSGGTGPLSHSKIDLRKDELRAMFSHIEKEYSNSAKWVLGASWLYNINAYRRLLPPDFVNSRVIYKNKSMTLPGQPFWGQFLNHSGSIKTEIRDKFMDNVRVLDRKALWKLFPYPVMTTKSPISTFYRFYDIPDSSV